MTGRKKKYSSTTWQKVELTFTRMGWKEAREEERREGSRKDGKKDKVEAVKDGDKDV